MHARRYVAASLFPGQLEDIFALTRFGEGLSATVAFLICPCPAGFPVDWMLVGSAGLAIPSYALAEWLHKRSAPPSDGSENAALYAH